jgi:hypothetical protein
MDEDLHAESVSHFTEFLVKYGKMVEVVAKMKIYVHGQYLIDPTEENKNQKDVIDALSEHVKNLIPFFIEWNKIEEKIVSK